MSDIKVGDTLFMFNVNRRRYGPNGGSPSYRHHFEEVEVTGETSRSWLVGPERYQTKVPKKDPWRVLFTAEMVEDAVWMNEHRYRIAGIVQSLRDVKKLRDIAAIVGYSE